MAANMKPKHHNIRALVLVSACVIALTPVLAQEAMPAATGQTLRFPINGFHLTGDMPLSSADTTRILAPFIGPSGSMDKLQGATAALEAELKAQGHALLRVTLPPQDLGQVVTLHVIKFVIGKVTVEGNAKYSDANIRASVPVLQEGQAPNFKALALQSTIANENPGKQVKVNLKESEEADKIDANLQVMETSPWNVTASIANTGSESTGRDRLSLVLGHANVWDSDQQFSAAYTTSTERSSDVKQVGLNYRIPLYSLGAVVALSYTNSDVVGNFGTFNSTGAGTTFGLTYTHYLPPDGDTRRMLTAGLDNKVFNASKINGVQVPGQVDRASRPLSVGYTQRVESDSALWGFNVEAAANLPGGDGNELVAYQTEDARIQGTQWKVVRGGANYLSTFGSGWLVSARTQMQWSADALISGEQFGLGGSTSVRGTAERVIAGDSGLSTTLELSSPEWASGLRALAFVDAGWIANHNAELNSAKVSRDQLSSAGVGLRYGRGQFALTAEWGRVINGSTPNDSNPAAPKAGDAKLHVSLSARF
jgi:hemolysin activation/secretion protein